MASHPPSLTRLMEELEKLPSVGPKTAQRLAFFILKADRHEAQQLASAILEVKDKIGVCSRCFFVTEDDPCAICRDPRRDQASLCIVQNPSDVIAFERLGDYHGLYHVLMGAISPLDGIGPDQLTIKALMQRLAEQPMAEVVLATNANAEGEATAIYLARVMKPFNLKITRLARGLPVGGDLEYADEATLAKALSGRREF